MSNIKKSEEEIKRAISNYMLESEPYIKMLVEIQSRKMPRAILNIGTGEVKFDYGDDLPIEIEIKKHLESLREKYSVSEQS